MVFRIITNGTEFAAQRATWFRWADLQESDFGDWVDFDRGMFYHRKIFKKYKDAEVFLYKKFGENISIVREWRPA